MSNTKKYWNSVDHLTEDPKFMEKAHNEFSENIPVDEFLSKQQESGAGTSRRDFLKFLGFSLTAATLAACETPVVKSIPYVVKPEEVTPGVANYYSSTFFDGNDYASVLVKTREGRPIFIEGNKLSAVTKGKVTARVNSSVLSLYDTRRYTGPLAGGEETSWDELDGQVTSKLDAIAAKGGNVRLLSGTIISPSTKAAVGHLSAKFNKEEGATNFKHVAYDSISYSGMIEANQRDFGKAVIPSYDFSKAKTIVSIDADFLNHWLLTSAYQNDYSKGRVPSKKGGMSQHFHFESVLSLTGSNADIRGAVKPSQLPAVAASLYKAVTGESVAVGDIEDDNDVAGKIAKAAKALKNSKGNSLVISGINDPNVQSIVNAINHYLGNYGNTIDLSNPLKIKQGKDAEVAELVSEMKSGKVDALIVYGTDPVFTMPAEVRFADALAKVDTKIALEVRPTETSKLCDFVAADSHYLESWNDFNPMGNHYSIQQPTINPLFDTRQAQASFLKWAGLSDDFYDFMKKSWEQTAFTMQSAIGFFGEFWNKVVHDGVFVASSKKPEAEGELNSVAESTFTNNAASSASALKSRYKSSGMELSLYVKNSIGDGSQSDNPWLQELPDPVSKVVWDNYITMNPTDMQGTYEIKTAQEVPADMATVTVGDQSITLPVVAIPGQKVGTIGIAVGYGKGKAGEEVIGKNAFPMTSMVNGNLSYSAVDVTVEKTGEKYPIASTQTHHTMMGRKIVNETTIGTYQKKDKHVWNEDPKLTDAFGRKKSPSELNLWNEHPIEKGHRWGMSIDLNACTGCGACVTACHAENNVPVVGRDEVRRTRTMSWLRIDRYYSSDADPKKNEGEKNYSDMEVPSTYPEVVYQPIMCQHCNHAPCETVCPVAATTHSNEGLNQMTYNRCVGTRYCANNCPFKVRRFNWFNYVADSKFVDVNPAQDELLRMVLNPDVTVRSRGVMEKCSMCVQRIQAGKLEAKKNGEPVQDGQIQTACSAACNGNAIKFGDLNDDSHTVWELKQDDRAYVLLEELGVKPNIYYQTKVRNVDTPEYEKNMETNEEHSA